LSRSSSVIRFSGMKKREYHDWPLDCKLKCSRIFGWLAPASVRRTII
jgi:hypothetical protein